MTDPTSRVCVALRVAASPAHAFDVFVRDIHRWWRPNGLFRTGSGRPGTLRFDAAAGGALTETAPGGEVFEIGRIRVWNPPRQLVFSWRQADFPETLETEVEVTFEPVGEETRVSVEHRGFHALPADSAARHGFPDRALLLRLGEWWHALLEDYRGTLTHRSS